MQDRMIYFIKVYGHLNPKECIAAYIVITVALFLGTVRISEKYLTVKEYHEKMGLNMASSILLFIFSFIFNPFVYVYRLVRRLMRKEEKNNGITYAVSESKAVEQLEEQRAIVKDDTMKAKIMDISIKALRKQMPVTPDYDDNVSIETSEHNAWTCPVCGKQYESKYNYCPDCGQKIFWEK